MPLSAGTKLGAYGVLALIGEGGINEVLPRTEQAPNREIAVKISSGRFSERFEREARAIAALNNDG